MKSGLKLATILLTLSILQSQEMARIKWDSIHSPPDGWRNIHHRSQKKKRILARRSNK